MKRHRYHYVMCERFVTCEAAVEHEKTQAIKPEAAAAINRIIVRELDGPGAREWWNQMGRGLFATDFSARVDKLLEQNSR